MKIILLASTNPGKITEFSALLDSLHLKIITPDDINLHLQIDEIGATYRENAELKALAFTQASGIAALADDSGLEVDALDGLPGLHSHRFLPDLNASDARRRTRLLELLSGKPRPWSAHFHCNAAIAFPDGPVVFTDGDCPGEIIPEERGTNGFGYDPIFQLAGRPQTMAELSDFEKNSLSHRAIAVKEAIPLLEEWLKKD